MKVLIFAETLSPTGGGGAIATYLFAHLLQKLDNDVTILIRNYHRFIDGVFDFKVVKVNFKGYGKYSLPLNLRYIKKLIQTSDIVYFAASSFNLIPLVKALGKPAVAHVHSYYPGCPIGAFYNFSRQAACNIENKSCSKCIWIYERARNCYSKAFGSTLLNSFFSGYFLKSLCFADAVIFPSKSQLRLFKENFDPKNLLKNAYFLSNPLPTVEFVPMVDDDLGFFGGTDPIKGFSTLHQAWINISHRYPNSKLHAGLTLGSRFSKKESNVIHYGLLSGYEYESVYCKLRAVIVPSVCPEPLPYVVLEACLRGKLLVASRIGGIPEQTFGLEGVRLVESGSVSELADAINWVLSIDKNEAQELGIKNREGVLRKFDNSIIVEKFGKILNNLVEKGN